MVRSFQKWLTYVESFSKNGEECIEKGLDITENNRKDKWLCGALPESKGRTTNGALPVVTNLG